MSLFLRDYRLIVGQPGVSVSGREFRLLQLRFKIVRTIKGGSQNKARMEIFNLAPSSRGVFETADDDTNNPAIILQTRYLYDTVREDFQTLFTGRVVNALTTKQGPDMVTQIEAADGYVPLRDRHTARNFPAGTTRRTVLDRLISDLGVPVGEIRDGGSLNQRFVSGMTVEGPIRLALDRLLDPVNVEWSIQDDSFVAVRKDLASEESILDLTPQTGLIGSPQARKARANRTEGSENEADSGIVIESLLSPDIRPNRRVRVQSDQYPDGQVFKVEKVTHDGDFRGKDWKSRAELIEFGTEVQ